MNIKIIYEDNDLIVIDKPAGLLVHPVSTSAKASADKKDEKDTLIDLMRQKYPEAQLVHRLDRDTSGIMMIAKNEKAYEFLKNQFQNREIKKKYIALVHGNFKEKTGIIAKSISKSRKRGGSQTTTPIGKKREAITRYKVIKEFPNYALLEVSPETGRTHQIRVHLASIGHPIAGDEKYKFKRQIQPEGLTRPRNAPSEQRGRHFLHASYLRFQMPDGNIKELHSNLPEELNKILENLCPTN